MLSLAVRCTNDGKQGPIILKLMAITGPVHGAYWVFLGEDVDRSDCKESKFINIPQTMLVEPACLSSLLAVRNALAWEALVHPR